MTASHVVWTSPKGSPFVPSPLLAGEYLYTINDMVSIASVHNAKTGEILGQLRLGEARRESFSASPVIVEGKIYFTNDDGETFVLSTAPDFKLLHVNRLRAHPCQPRSRWRSLVFSYRQIPGSYRQEVTVEMNIIDVDMPTD